uniref:Uncharacterized protein n=1 Tax=Rhipicephalus zambeziensis TaxID=60191 RepID=A0A224YBZ9_9ACAR
MAVNRTTTALDAVLADASVLRNDTTLRPFKPQKRNSGRVASPSASVQVTCSSERYSDEPPLKRQKPDVKAQEKQVRQRKPPPVRLKPAIKAQERRLRPLAPKLPPNAGALLNSGVPPNSGILPNFGLLNVVNSKQGAVPMSSSKPVTLLLLCKPVRPDTSQTSLLKPASDAGREPGITIVTSDESGVVYTTVTRVGNKETNSDTSSNAMSANVKESTGETEIIGIPSVDIGVKQCMSSNHEKRASAACDSVVLSTTRKLATDPAHTTGIARASVTGNDASELCNAGVTPVKEMSSSSEPLMVAIPTPNFHLEHCEPEEGHAPGISAPRRTMLGAGECVAGALTMISNLSEQTGILRSVLMKAEKAFKLNTSSITSPGSAKVCAAEPAIIGIPTVNIDTEHIMSEAGEKQTFRLCSPGKIKLELPEYTECATSFSGDPSEDNHTVLNRLPAVESTLHASCTSTNATLSPVVEGRSKLAAFGVTHDASDVEHKTSTVVMGQPSSPPAQSSITSFPARDVATKPTVNGIPSDKTALFCCQLKLVKDELFELCAPSSDTDICANDVNDCATNSAGSDVPPESSVVEHSVSTAVESRASTSYSSCNAISSAMKRTSGNISVLAVCNEKTSNAPSTMRIPECSASLPHTSSNSTSELETHMDSNSASLPRSMPRSSTPSSPATTFQAERRSLKNPLNYFKKELFRSLHSSERTKEIVNALKHKVTAPQSKVMFYREKVNSLKLQFHNAQRIMKQPLTEDFGCLL